MNIRRGTNLKALWWVKMDQKMELCIHTTREGSVNSELNVQRNMKTKSVKTETSALTMNADTDTPGYANTSLDSDTASLQKDVHTAIR